MTEKNYKIIVALYLRGDTLDPDYITETLGILPSDSQYKGQKHITSTGHEVTYKIGMWSLTAKTDSNNLVDHVNWLLSNVEGNSNSLQDLRGVEEAYVDIFIAAESDERGGGSCDFEFNQSIISGLAKLKLPVRFTVEVVRENLGHIWTPP